MESKICISDKFTGGARAVGPGATLGEPLLWDFPNVSYVSPLLRVSQTLAHMLTW